MVAEVRVMVLWSAVKEESVDEEGKVLVVAVVKGIISGF